MRALPIRQGSFGLHRDWVCFGLVSADRYIGVNSAFAGQRKIRKNKCLCKTMSFLHFGESQNIACCCRTHVPMIY